MAHEHDLPPRLSPSVWQFIAAEAAKRGIRRWEVCATQLMQEIGLAIEVQAQRPNDDRPSALAEDSPGYNPVVHGARSDHEVVDLLRARIDSMGDGPWLTMDEIGRAHV